MSQKEIVLVTGASKGIGAAVAQLFAKNGFDVCLNFQFDEKGALAVAKACEDLGARAIVVPANVSVRREVEEMFDVCNRELGPLTCLVNNAGIIGGASSLADLSEEALATTFQTNVFGSIYCLQEAIKQMSTADGGAGGAIVNMSSVAATLGSAHEYVHYAASKGAIETLTIGAGKELAPLGIRVNAVRVGTTNTTMHAANGNPDRVHKVAAVTPMGRIADPKEIAEAALWLGTSRSSFVTGTCLTVAGGLSA